MRSWEHSGFSVDQSVLLEAGGKAGIERLVQYPASSFGLRRGKHSKVGLQQQ